MSADDEPVLGARLQPADGREIVAALGDPSFYPHRPGRVELRETHISWVFLAGSRAYKVKKPVSLPFLDYGTRERRRWMCHEEVRLNRQLAASIYLGVRSIVRRDSALALERPDHPDAVEFTVEMRRFAEERTLARLLGRGEATVAQLEAVGARLARFHRGAPRPGLRPPDALRAFHRIVSENFEALLDGTAGTLDEDDVMEARRFSDRFLAARRERMLKRVRAGRWRDGHGDLRAEHVVLEDGIDVVDCIEFDPALRRIDGAFDLAFLAMEVEELGTRELADALVSGYRSAGGDPGSPPLLAFYCAQRAWIRCKVALVRAGQLEAAARQDAVAEGVRLFALGRRLAWRSRLPLALVVCGPPASGKSHLARAVRGVTGLPHLNSDVVRKRLAGVEPMAVAGSEHYAPEFTERTYRELARLAATELGRGGGVIVDATYRRAEARRGLAAALAPTGARVVFVECVTHASTRTERARLRRRSGGAVSDAGPTVAERLAREFEPLDEVLPGGHVTVRTDLPTAEAVRELERALDAAPFDQSLQP